MRLVVDSSVAVEIALAGGALETLADHELIAPSLLLSEATSVLLELAWRGVIPREHARKAVDYLVSIPITRIDDEGHHRRAWELAASLGWAKTYDAEYLALALAQDAALVTLDERLLRGAGHVVKILAPLDVRPG